MEFIRKFQKTQKILLIDSEAIFVFENCPRRPIQSEKVEIPEIGAKWWVEISSADRSNLTMQLNSHHEKPSTISMHLEVSNLPSGSVLEGIFELGLQNTESFIVPIKHSRNVQSDVSEPDRSPFNRTHSFTVKGNGYYHTHMKSLCCDLKEQSRFNSYEMKWLSNDITIKGRVKITGEPLELKGVSGNVGTSALFQKFGNLLDSHDLSDFTFIISGERFQVHKLILNLASPYFYLLFTSEFKENENNVFVTDEDPKVFRQMLEYIYKGKLPENFPDVAIDLYKMAHLYQVESLLPYCKGHVNALIIDNVNVLKIYKFAAEYEMTDLFERSWAFMRNNILQVPKPRALERSPLSMEEIDEFIKLNEEYERKISELYQKH